MTGFIGLITIALTVVSAPRCESDAWPEALTALDRADAALIQVWRASYRAGDQQNELIARRSLGDMRVLSSSFVLETASLDCVRNLIRNHREAYLSYNSIVTHSFPGENQEPELIEQALAWNEVLFSDGAIHSIPYGGLIDRYEIGKRDRQLYGSHLACTDGEWRFEPPVHEPENLEARRAAIGWPGEETDAMLGEPCGPAASNQDEPAQDSENSG